MRSFDKLVVAISLALAGGGTQASLVTGSANSNSELFFIAQDANGHTFVSDLGVSYSTLAAANAASTDWFTSVNFGALVTPGSQPGQFTFGPGVQWNLAAARLKSSAPYTTDNNGVFGTFNTAASPADSGTLQTGTSTAAFNTAITKLNSYRDAVIAKANSLNTDPGQVDAGSHADAFPDAISANNDFYVFSEQSGARTWDSAWNDDFNNRSVFKTSATIGTDDSLAFYHWYVSLVPGQTNKFQVNSDLLAGVWTLSETGVLSYGAAASPVPLPASLVLFSAGLLGLLRRRHDVPA